MGTASVLGKSAGFRLSFLPRNMTALLTIQPFTCLLYTSRGNAAVVPTVEEVRAYVGESLFDDFFTELTQKEGAKPVMEFGRCSWEYGWNMKFKKSGKTLCTLYPREHFFTVMVVIGQREKAAAEALLRCV